MKRFFAGLGCFFAGIALSSHVALAEPDLMAQKAGTDSIRKVYDQLMSQKGTSPLLEGLNEEAIKVDDLGWAYLEYSRTLDNGEQFYLLLRALPIKAEDAHKSAQGYKEFLDSFLGLKLTMYMTNPAALGDLDLDGMIRTAISSVYSSIKERPPLRLQIVPAKGTFHVGEKIAFELILSNEGAMTLKLSKMDEKSVQCFFNEDSWGSLGAEINGPEAVILGPGESLHKKLLLKAKKPGDMDIRCTYGLKFMGDQPTARTVIPIE